MDITLNEFNAESTVFICTNIQETDLAGHAEDVARYAERLQLVDLNLSRLLAAMDQMTARWLWPITVTIRPLVTAIIPGKLCRYWYINRGWSLRN